jgi:hypothetical protein
MFSRGLGGKTMTRAAVLILIFCGLGSAASGAAPVAWKKFHDAMGFSVSVPADWSVDPNASQVDFSTDDNPPPPIRVFAIAPSVDQDPGSTLGGVEISISSLPPGRAGCTAAGFFANESPDSSLDADIDTPSYAHASGDDPGGWYTTEGYAWRLSTKPCLGVQYTISYQADGSDQAKSEKPFDRERLLKLLDSIRETIVLDPER